MPDIEVLKSYTYKGVRYNASEIHRGAPRKFADLMCRINKASPYSETENKRLDSSKKEDHQVLVSDSVKKLADQEGINIEDVDGTGANGRINKKDIENYKTRMITAGNSRNLDGSEYSTTAMIAETEKTDEQ